MVVVVVVVVGVVVVVTGAEVTDLANVVGTDAMLGVGELVDAADATSPDDEHPEAIRLLTSRYQHVRTSQRITVRP